MFLQFVAVRGTVWGEMGKKKLEMGKKCGLGLNKKGKNIWRPGNQGPETNSVAFQKRNKGRLIDKKKMRN